MAAVAQSPRTLAELVEATDLPRATAHRLAVALEVHRLLARDPEGRFVPGARRRERPAVSARRERTGLRRRGRAGHRAADDGAGRIPNAPGGRLRRAGVVR